MVQRSEQFFETITDEDWKFVEYFRKKALICWRCIFLLFKQNDDLELYREKDKFELYDAMLAKKRPKLEVETMQTPSTSKSCQMCFGVLENCENLVDSIHERVIESGYEFSDFKLTFSLSVQAPLFRHKAISDAEQCLGLQFGKTLKNQERYVKSAYR